MRKDNLNSKRATAVLDREMPVDALEKFYRPATPSPRRVSTGSGRPTPIEFPEDIEDPSGDGEFQRSPRRSPVRRSRFPQSKAGRIGLGVAVLAVAGTMLATVLGVRDFLMHDPRFRIESSASIQIQGNSHVTRSELLSTFGEDIGRNIFYVPLAQRKLDLESLPWVQQATVMRLLPNRLRVAVTERTPIAFVREGSRIGLVDAHGVLLDMAANTVNTPTYSFPVVIGVTANEPLSTREAQMKLFQRFTGDLDSDGEKISEQLSEIDLSNPEDVKALILDQSTDILVHFGDQDFLQRYHGYVAHLPEWKQQYPRLASVDMRYPRQVVLEMQPGSGQTTASGTDDHSPSAQATTQVNNRANSQANGQANSQARDKTQAQNSSESVAKASPRAKVTASAKTSSSPRARAAAAKAAAQAKARSAYLRRKAAAGHALPGHATAGKPTAAGKAAATAAPAAIGAPAGNSAAANFDVTGSRATDTAGSLERADSRLSRPSGAAGSGSRAGTGTPLQGAAALAPKTNTAAASTGMSQTKIGVVKTTYLNATGGATGSAISGASGGSPGAIPAGTHASAATAPAATVKGGAAKPSVADVHSKGKPGAVAKHATPVATSSKKPASQPASTSTRSASQAHGSKPAPGHVLQGNDTPQGGSR